MQRLSLSLALIGLCAACAPANAGTLDPSRPAHCVAAFGYARYWFLKDTAPDSERHVRAMETRGAFALRGMSAAERDAAKAEGLSLLRTHVSDRAAMDRLFLTCAEEQDRDPAFAAFAPAMMQRLRAMNAR